MGLPEREQKIEQYKNYLNILGQAGIHYTTYAHMANIKMPRYYQTNVAAPQHRQHHRFNGLCRRIRILIGFGPPPSILWRP